MYPMNHLNLSTKGLNCLDTISTLYNEFFGRRDYEWWYKVQPGDIVVDIGACIGLFTRHALDNGAKKVYAIEPNSELLQTTLTNAFPYIVNRVESPVVPINCAIGDPNNFNDYVGNVFFVKDRSTIPMRTFKQILEEYSIDHIDYLKIDAEGAEFNVLIEENIEFIKNNVKHIAVEVHLDASPRAPESFINFRDNFLSHFSEDKVKYLLNDSKAKTYDDKYIKSKWPIGWGSCWMIYICNKSLPSQ
ncbi:MAG: FkbM family methyltransferase [Betaproteobacteria bacterium]|nr:FkbM family methyltransferase [Betaproteobacteria bacterium]